MKLLGRLRPSPAMVVALIALVVAASGTGYAVSRPANNSVGPKQLRNKAVTSAKIRNGAVGAAKLRDGAVTAAKIRKGAVRGNDVVAGSIGKVPDSDNLDGRDSSDFVSASKLVTFSEPVSRAEGARQVARFAPFTLVGKCLNDASKPGNVIAQLEAQTDTNHSYFGSKWEFDNDWNINETRTVWSHSAPAGSRSVASSDLTVFSPNGVSSFMRDGEPLGLLVGFPGSDCRFIGHLVVYR